MTRRISLLSRYSHTYLLTTLLLLLGVQPFFHEEDLGQVLIRVLLFVSLGSAALSCSESRRQRIVFQIIFVPMLAAGVVWWVTDSLWVQRAYFLFSVICCAYIVTLILQQIFRSSYVSANTINGALCVYLLLGVLWAFLYMVLESWTAAPQFDFGSRVHARDSETELMSNLMGFSYITLTTLGYGNITPNTPQADALTMMEAITGQIYLTLLVARLVGIQVSQDALRLARRDAEQANPK